MPDSLLLMLNGRPVHFLGDKCGTSRSMIRDAHRSNARWVDPDQCRDRSCFRCYLFDAVPCVVDGCEHVVVFGSRQYGVSRV